MEVARNLSPNFVAIELGELASFRWKLRRRKMTIVHVESLLIFLRSHTSKRASRSSPNYVPSVFVIKQKPAVRSSLDQRRLDAEK